MQVNLRPRWAAKLWPVLVAVVVVVIYLLLVVVVVVVDSSSSEVLHQEKLKTTARKLSIRSLASNHVNSANSTLQATRNSTCPTVESSATGTGSGVAQAASEEQQQQQQVAAYPSDQQRASFGYVQARVSDFVKPNFYTLRLKVDPNKRKFSGQLMVSLEIVDAPAQSSNLNSTGSSSNSTAGSSNHRYLTLHAGLNLHIKKAFYVFKARNDIQIPATKIGRNLERGLLTLDFHPNSIESNAQGLLLLVYSGAVNETDSHGLFVHHRHAFNSTSVRTSLSVQQSNSTNANSENTELGLATQMEPSFARRLFPCWDEPHLKARFNLIVILPFRNYESLSNMPVKRKSISLSCSGEPLQEVEFHTTPSMSSYLLTLVIGKFDYIETITSNQCKIRLYFYANQTTSGGGEEPIINQRRQAAQFALELAGRTFDWLESLLGVRYALAKFDMIALRDFNSGAMENWGVSIFHENYLLCDSPLQPAGNNSAASTSSSTAPTANIRVNGGTTRPKRLVVPLVVAHEIVHQWFGNLITSRSWTYLWLNEGFAQLLMYDVAHALMPSENYWHIFLEDNRASAMRDDELITSSRALELDDEQLEASDDHQRMSLFDQLTYNKGAMLIQMVRHALGPAEFTSGLRHYLLKHSYDSVSSHDLWRALEESSSGRRLQDGQLESMMSSWLKLEGFPLISVQVSEQEQDDTYLITLSQERFTLLPVQALTTSFNNQSRAPPVAWSSWLWSTPVTLASEAQPSPTAADFRLWPATTGSRAMLLQERSGSFRLARQQLGAWFKVNAQALGYFRVDYATGSQVDMLARLKGPLREQTLSVVDRYNLLDDLFAMVLSGRKSLVYYLRYTTHAYAYEHDPLVLRLLFDSWERVRQALISNGAGGVGGAGGQLEGKFSAYVQRFLRNLIGTLRARVATVELATSASDLETAMTHRLLAAAPSTRQRKLRPPTLSARKLRRNVAGDDDADDADNHRQSSSSSSSLASSTLSSLSSSTTQLISLDTQLRAQLKQQRAQNNSAAALMSVELLELLDAQQLTYSGDAYAQLSGHARDLFARLHFRSLVENEAVRNLIDSMGRELRASIYASALNYRSDSSSNNNNNNNNNNALDYDEKVYTKLLELYDSSDNSLERSAIAQALGSVRNATRQAQLLNMTLTRAHFFRTQDASLLLESMASSSRTGRALIWSQLNTKELKMFKQRQLLQVALKCVSRGLIEPITQQQQQQQQQNVTTTIEGQLRQLYVIYGSSEHGPLIGQAIEWVRINSLWFERDYSQLMEFLSGSGSNDN